MTHETQALIRNGTRAAAALAPAGGIALLVVELSGPEQRASMLAGAGALIAAGPLFWVLAKAHLVVLGATAALLLGVALIALGAAHEGSGAGFDLGLGICLAGVSLWTLWGHWREEKE